MDVEQAFAVDTPMFTIFSLNLHRVSIRFGNESECWLRSNTFVQPGTIQGRVTSGHPDVVNHVRQSGCWTTVHVVSSLRLATILPSPRRLIRGAIGSLLVVFKCTHPRT